jgi:pre-peptidase
MRWSVVVLLAVVCATPASAQTHAVGSWREMVRRLRDIPTVRHKPARSSAGANLATTANLETIVDEGEPNNDVSTADSLALGDQASGAINPAGDVDTWFVDLRAGEFVSIDVDASQFGSPLDPTLVLLAPDGRTVVAFNDDFDEADSRISYRVPASGRYFVVMGIFGQVGGGPEFRYAINFGKVICDADGTDSEPNGTPATARRTAVGFDASGEICATDGNPAGDVDYWKFEADAGTTIEVDVDAASLGRLVDPAIELFAPDGTTRLAFNDDRDGVDSRLRFSIAASGVYFVTVATITDPGGNPFPYVLHIRSIAPGPGDPTTVRAEGIGLPLGLAVGRTGDLFVGDIAGNRVVRISVEGTVTTFANGISAPFGLAFDASGALLVASVDGAVYRVTPDGQARRFIIDTGLPFWIAVAPDGRIWLTDLLDGSLRRYSSTGQPEARFDGTPVGGSGPGPLAISPSGEPYISQGTEVWKLSDGRFEPVFSDPALIWAFAFDVAGNIYAPMPTIGRIKLFDPAGRPLADPFVVGVDAPQVVAFGRDGAGATVARIVVTDPLVGRVLEVNPTGVQHPGLPVGFSAPFTPEVAAASLLGDGGLSAAQLRFLDEVGNRNGRFDVGDFQAYLRTINGLPMARSAP